MKRNENRKNRNWRNFVVLTLVCMLAATLVGCKTSTAVTPEPSSTSEVVSEPVSEPVSEEISEPISEEVSEEEEVDMDLTPYSLSNGKSVVDLANDMSYNELKIIVWNQDNAKEILSEGDSYEVEEGDNFFIYYPEKMNSIVVNTDKVKINTELDYVCNFGLFVSGENVEVTFTTTDIDGKEYEITVYFTKE